MGILGIAVVVGLVVFPGLLPGFTGHTLRGTITVEDTDTEFSAVLTTGGPGSSCFTSRGYDDIDFGSTVTVKDSTGRIIATGQLQQGQTVNSTSCRFAFEIASVPVSDFYSVEIGHRGAVTYSSREMDTFGWLLQLSLGD